MSSKNCLNCEHIDAISGLSSIFDCFHQKELISKLIYLFSLHSYLTPSTCTASSIASHLISPPSTANRALMTDYAPILRDMCRSEKTRLDAGRRTSSTNRGHYLRHLIALNSFGNDYFNEQTEMFPKLDD